MFYSRAYVQLLQDTVSELRARNERLEAERVGILDRLLERKNIEPLRQSADEGASQMRPAIQIISPTGAMLPEMEDAVKESWVAEETQYIIDQQGLDYDRARTEAERAWVQYNKVMK